MENNIKVQVERKSNTLYIVLGWVSAVLSVVRLPFIFGVIALIMGILATRNGSRAGMALIMSSTFLMAVGLAFDNIIFSLLFGIAG